MVTSLNTRVLTCQSSKQFHGTKIQGRLLDFRTKENILEKQCFIRQKNKSTPDFVMIDHQIIYPTKDKNDTQCSPPLDTRCTRDSDHSHRMKHMFIILEHMFVVSEENIKYEIIILIVFFNFLFITYNKNYT